MLADRDPAADHDDVARRAPRSSASRGRLAVVGDDLGRRPARRRRARPGPATECALELRIAPGRSGSPGSWSSSPVVSTVTRGRRAQATSRAPDRGQHAEPRPARARRPAASTVSPAAMSSPARRMSRPGSTATRTSTVAVAARRCPRPGPPRRRPRAPSPRSRSRSPRPRRAPGAAGWPARDSSTTREAHRPLASRPRCRRRAPRSRPSPSCRSPGTASALVDVLGQHPAERLARAPPARRRAARRARAPAGAPPRSRSARGHRRRPRG